MDQKRLAQLLEKHDAGTATESEIREIETFANALIGQQGPEPFKTAEEKERIRLELRQRIAPAQGHSSFRWMSIAASVVVILGVSIGLWFGLLREDHSVAIAGAGEVLTITLEDGTEVSLNSGSTLEYPGSFDEGHRDVVLHGEALFKVASDKDRPFTVHTNGVATQVLGTVFNINSYSEDSLVVVSLIEGSVKVSSALGERTLEPMQEAEFDLKSGRMHVDAFDSTSSAIGWSAGEVVFDRMSFDRLCRFIGRKYNVTVNLEQPAMKEYTISGRLHQPSLEVLLATVCAAKGLSYKKSGDGEYLIFQPK